MTARNGPRDDERRSVEGSGGSSSGLARHLESTDGTDRTAPRHADPVNVWGYGYCTVGVRGKPATTMFVTCVFCGHCHRHTARPDFTSGKRKASCGRGAYVVHLVTLEGRVAA